MNNLHNTVNVEDEDQCYTNKNFVQRFYTDWALSEYRKGPTKEEKEISALGKPVELIIKIWGNCIAALIDTGAQATLINAKFLIENIKRSKIQVTELVYDPKDNVGLTAAFGAKCFTMGTVMIPVERKKSRHLLKMYVVDAPLSSPVIMGTASMHELGICLLDEPNDVRIRMEKLKVESSEITVENLRVNSVVAITFEKQVLRPRSFNIVKLQTPFNCNDREFVTEICISDRHVETIGIDSHLIKPSNSVSFIKVLNRSDDYIELNKGEVLVKLEEFEEILETAEAQQNEINIQKFQEYMAEQVKRGEPSNFSGNSEHGNEIEILREKWGTELNMSERGIMVSYLP